MKEIGIKHLAYLIKQAKDARLPQPIFFLGAGASRTGKIPSASEIVEYILANFSDNPFIIDLSKEKRTYANLMDCLSPAQRDTLLKKYIDEAKINVTHLYLAQLIKEGYSDYVLTVNFDNLMLRALALYNIYPATYDMAILKDLTTTKIKEKSVVYLHGQSHGLWLLNTQEEMEKVKNTVPRIFDSIKDGRPWVFIGYSGEDPIFEHIQKLGRFDNGLYWVTYKDNMPNENVYNFLCTPNTNAFLIKGFDSDSFMIKLNKELELPQPEIIDKPFSALSELLNGIVDIEEEDDFKGVKEKLAIANKQVDEAIELFEKGNKKSANVINKNTDIDLLRKEIIDLIISETYDEGKIADIEKRTTKFDNKNIVELLSVLYSQWGASLGKLAESKEDEASDALFQQAFDKYEKVISIKPDSYNVYLYWGGDLVNLAKKKEGDISEVLYQQAFEKFDKAVSINPDSYYVYLIWGTVLGKLAEKKEGTASEALYQQAFEKYQRAFSIEPDRYETYVNWGANLSNLAKKKDGDDSDILYQLAIEKYEKVISLKPNDHEAYYSYGLCLMNLALRKEGETAEKLYQQALEKCQKARELGGKVYNLACLYALKGNKEQALIYLDESLNKKEIKVNFVRKDEDWKEFLEDADFIEILEKYSKKV